MRLLRIAAAAPFFLLLSACSAGTPDLGPIADKAEADYEERGEMGEAGDVRFVAAERAGPCVAVELAYPEERGGNKVIVPMRLGEGGDEDDPADWEVLGFPSGALEQLDGDLERCGYP